MCVTFKYFRISFSNLQILQIISYVITIFPFNTRCLYEFLESSAIDTCCLLNLSVCSFRHIEYGQFLLGIALVGIIDKIPWFIILITKQYFYLNENWNNEIMSNDKSNAPRTTHSSAKNIIVKAGYNLFDVICMPLNNLVCSIRSNI